MKFGYDQLQMTLDLQRVRECSAKNLTLWTPKKIKEKGAKENEKKSFQCHGINRYTTFA